MPATTVEHLTPASRFSYLFILKFLSTSKVVPTTNEVVKIHLLVVTIKILLCLKLSVLDVEL